tara:strand:+ start:40 stop:168 length:129 start_codon:yes stop_codon:yes gene_type:complete
VVDQLHLGNAEFIFWDGAHVAPLHEKKESEDESAEDKLEEIF